MYAQKELLLSFWNQHFKFRDSELRAFREINREDFVHDEFKPVAYSDRPLPLLRGKTISQPSTIMIMTHALELEEGNKVFEVGTGSGFQAAIAAKIVGEKGKVVTAEVIPELVSFAKQNLKKAGIGNVFVYEEDGSNGLSKESPFDRIIITAACREFPKSLLEQLRSGGIIVGPVGDQNEQEMVKGIKREDGKLDLEFLGQFLFTPMYGKYGFED